MYDSEFEISDSDQIESEEDSYKQKSNELPIVKVEEKNTDSELLGSTESLYHIEVAKKLFNHKI